MSIPTHHNISPLSVAFAVALAIAFAGFTALGVWQVKRLAWKLDLIERVESRVHAPPVAAPGPAEWAHVDAASHEYLHVVLEGRFLPGLDAKVQAVTELGAGFWLLAPFETADGGIVLINRGFVPPDRVGETAPPADTRMTGLLRISEPGGAFLRDNDPANDRWYSRDVQAIATARGLREVAPYFVDAGRNPDADVGAPVGGLTVVRFRNHHLVYALTWFALALMSAAAFVYLLRDARRGRR
ncbi:SURF1 family protein [Marilutibacter alkalisoli]|uniref:SURF1-like protein n=1 Tax=Marilutibacter alkalisoli TaxID=2591633 RepID=A0A514BVG1_9GAMM|nr:SURF1 family protein [Lysobacter alkalisoli]QDH71393.1 SURF1 family protein [Lysobacter alkalisoli]